MGVFTNGRTPTPPRSRRNTRRTGRIAPPLGPLAAPSPHPGARSLPPGETRQAPLPFSAHRSLTAAAKSIDLTSTEEIARLSRRRGSDEWQTEAWEYFDLIGELKYALGMVANVMSRVRLYAAEVKDPSQPPAMADPDSPGGGAAISALRRLDSAYGGQPGLIRDAGLNLAVTGECYLVQIPGTSFPNQTAESWDIRSTDELTVNASGTVTLTTRREQDAASKKVLSNKAFVARIWRPHPRYSDESDSSMRGILDSCAEMLLINKTFRATARSRLNAGMLYLPDGLSVAAQPDAEVLPEDDPDVEAELFAPPTEDASNDTDEFEEALLDAMITPITDEESASAVVPLLVRGPADLADKIKLIKFERSFDTALVARAVTVLERILNGIDVPKDVVTGMANVKYANATQIDEDLYRAHIEPLILLLCDALTVVYLRPALKAAGIDESELQNYVIWYDPSEVTTRPNKAADAQTGFANHLLSGSAWRRAHGFSDDDAPSPEEVAIRLMIEKATITPELGEALLAVFAPDVMARVREQSQASNPAPLPPDVAQALGDPVTPAPDATPGPDAQGQPPPPPQPTPPTQPGPGDSSIPADSPQGKTYNPEDLV